MPYVKRKVKDLRVGDRVDFEFQVFRDLLKWDIPALQSEIDNEDSDEWSDEAQSLYTSQDATFEIEEEPTLCQGNTYWVSTGDSGTWLLDGDAILQTEEYYDEDEEIQ